jgi:hypothetical protein
VKVHVPQLSSYVVPHPDPQIDLCIIACGAFLQEVVPETWSLRHAFLGNASSLSDETAGLVRPIEPIIMIGYPNALLGRGK